GHIAARQPYHNGRGRARQSGEELTALLRSVRHYGERAVLKTIRDYERAGHSPIALGIVVGSLIDPRRIGNDHIRIHALEGQLFRGIVEASARRAGVPYSIWRERDLYGAASEEWKCPADQVRAR